MLVATFKLRNLTKGTARYEEVPAKDADVVIGALYIRKTALADRIPEVITVTIAED